MSRGIVLEGGGRVLADRVHWARSYREKARGLLGRDSLSPGEGLVIEQAHQVHTFGMRFPIDVVFCDAGWHVLRVVRSMRPFRMTRWVPRSRYVVELAANGAAAVRPGDRLSLRDPSTSGRPG